MTEIDWTEALADEMSCGDFADPRLGRRLGLIVRKLASDPAVSFPKVFTGAELEAAYRLAMPVTQAHFERSRRPRKQCIASDGARHP
jgi:hypothetical protein